MRINDIIIIIKKIKIIKRYNPAKLEGYCSTKTVLKRYIPAELEGYCSTKTVLKRYSPTEILFRSLGDMMENAVTMDAMVINYIVTSFVETKENVTREPATMASSQQIQVT